MTLTTPQHEEEIRCPAVIADTTDRRYGERCNQLLLKANSKGEMAGEIKCRCGAIVEIVNGRAKILPSQKLINQQGG